MNMRFHPAVSCLVVNEPLELKKGNPASQLRCEVGDKSLLNHMPYFKGIYHHSSMPRSIIGSYDLSHAVELGVQLYADVQ